MANCLGSELGTCSKFSWCFTVRATKTLFPLSFLLDHSIFSPCVFFLFDCLTNFGTPCISKAVKKANQSLKNIFVLLSQQSSCKPCRSFFWILINRSMVTYKRRKLWRESTFSPCHRALPSETGSSTVLLTEESPSMRYQWGQFWRVSTEKTTLDRSGACKTPSTGAAQGWPSEPTGKSPKLLSPVRLCHCALISPLQALKAGDLSPKHKQHVKESKSQVLFDEE